MANDVAALIQEGYSTEFLSAANSNSVVASTARRVNMGTRTEKLPVLSVLPRAAFVGYADANRTKPSSNVGWESKTLSAQEIAVIVPVRQEDIEDASVDLLTEIARLGGQAIGRALDEAILFGEGKPTEWTSPDLFAAATAAGQVFQVGTGEDDLAGSFYQAAGAVAGAGYEPSALVARSSLKYRLANLRGSGNQAIFIPSLNAGPGAADSVAGLNASWATNGSWDSSKAEALVFDPTRVILGVRTDIQVAFADQASIGGVSLFENDMVALRFRARYAYALGDVAQPDGTRTTPVAAVTPAAG